MKCSVLLGFLLVIFYCNISYSGGREYQHLPNFEVPKSFFNDHDFHPAGYLSSYPIKDTKKSLNDEEKKCLINLFVRAAEACKEKYHQDYHIRTSVPIYVLLRNNFPGVSSVETEGGNIIFLEDIAKVVDDENNGVAPKAPVKAGKE